MRLPALALLLMLTLVAGGSARAQDADSIASVQGELVRAAALIRSVERQLHDLDRRLAVLRTKSAALEKDYTARRVRMASTLSALSHLGRTPREAVLIRPGGPLQAARSSMLLSASFPVIRAEAESYRTLLTDLEKTRRELAEKSATAKAKSAELKAQHRKLAGLLDARRTATAAGLAQWQSAARNVAGLARAARTLRDFLGNLDAGPSPQDMGAIFQALPDDDGQMPVSGIVRVAYGAKDSIGAKSSGISIETLPGTLVVAPMAGVVRYAGPFKGYGNIVIIAHKGGYHSLLAGLDKISVEEGQTIVSGEPIAILDGDSDANPGAPAPRKTLYYELRRAGQPVNPSQKLPGLG